MAQDRKYYKGRRDEMLEFLPDSFERVLEIGCGEGVFLDELNCAEKWGLDIDEKSVDVLRAKGIRPVFGRYEDVQDSLPDGYFDVIVCNDVIEHMPDHEMFFKNVKKKLKKNGVLAGSIPNVRFYKNLKHVLFEKDWKYADSGILDRTHLRFFTYKSLKRSLLESGYEIVRYEGIRGSKKPLLRLFIALGFGAHWDIRFQQIGFCVRDGEI